MQQQFIDLHCRAEPVEMPAMAVAVSGS